MAPPSLPAIAVTLALVGCPTLTRPARAQTEEAPEAPAQADAVPEPPEGDAPPPPALPAPTLDEEPVLPEPLPVAPPEPEEAPQILYRIGPGRHPEWEEDARDGASAPADVAFEVPGDLRTTGAPMRLPQDDDTPDVLPFGVSVGIGYARLLGIEGVDLFRLEQRFHARVPGIEFLYLGAAASQMLAANAILGGGGPRVGLGATFCGSSWIRCEGVAFVQPGFVTGDLVGTRFDLNAALEARFLLPPTFELGVSAGYSLLGNTSIFHASATGGAAF